MNGSISQAVSDVLPNEESNVHFHISSRLRLYAPAAPRFFFGKYRNFGRSYEREITSVKTAAALAHLFYKNLNGTSGRPFHKEIYQTFTITA